MEQHTESDDPLPPLVTDEDEVAKIEAQNALRQFDAGMKMIEAAIRSSTPYRLYPSHFFELNRIATESLCRTSGEIRQRDVRISNCDHVPPPTSEVAGHLQDLCKYINDNWSASAVHLAAYVLWKLNWIHPFADGNGRTSRMISYVILSIRLGFVLPGTPTIPEQIVVDKQPYYSALAMADEQFKKGKVNVLKLEELLGEMLGVQLINLLHEAMGMD